MQIFTVTFDDALVDQHGMAVVVADDEDQAKDLTEAHITDLAVTSATKIGSGLAPGRVIMWAWDTDDDD